MAQQEAQLRSLLAKKVKNVLDKVVLSIIYSRLPLEKKKEHPLSSGDRNLSSLEPVRLRSLFNEWTNHNRSLVINVYCTPIHSNSRVLLEKWKIGISKGNDVFGTNPKLSLQQYHSMFRTLIRAVSCSLRILPTYIFLQKPESGVSSYSLDLEPHEDDLKDDIAFNSCITKTFEFKNIDVLFGYTEVKVCYRADCSPLIPKKSIKKIEIIENYSQELRDKGDTTSNSIDVPVRVKKTSISPISSPTRHSFLNVGAKAFKNSPSKSPILSITPPSVDLHSMFLGDTLVKSVCSDDKVHTSNSEPMLSGISSESSLLVKGKSLTVAPFREKTVFQDTDIAFDSSSSTSFSETSFLFQDVNNSMELLGQSELFTNSLSDELGEFLQFCSEKQIEVSTRTNPQVSKTLQQSLHNNISQSH